MGGESRGGWCVGALVVVEVDGLKKERIPKRQRLTSALEQLVKIGLDRYDRRPEQRCHIEEK